jgi:uncharacterized membrane protein (UPF0127 family)
VQNKKLILEIILTVLVVLLGAWAYLSYMPSLVPTSPTTTLQIGSNTIVAELAATDAARIQGLSGRPALAQGHGMFFVFDKPSEWGIWMKDMQFPIDILWADENGMVVSIKEDVSPQTYPTIFTSTSPALYVLELPAGYVQAHAIAIGAQIVVK